MKKLIFILLVAGLVAGAGILLKNRMQEAEDAPFPIPMAVSVKIVTPKESALRQTKTFLAQLTSIDIATIASRLNGLIIAVQVTENQPVKKGDLLVQVDDRETLSAIKSLEETLKSQESDLQYTQALHTSKDEIFKVGGLSL
jgi:multidrug efflux pump subunit AcrA (membrane-fusion protein)